MRKPAYSRHFGKVFVRKPQSVLPRAIQTRIARLALVLRDHLLSPAAVSRYRMAHEGIIGGNQSARDQGIYERDKSARMAARNGYAFRGNDLFAVRLGKFGKTVRPIGRSSMRGRGVDDADAPAFRKRYSLPRSRVGQAQKDDIRGIYTFFARGGVLAEFFGKRDQSQIRTLTKPLVDL